MAEGFESEMTLNFIGYVLEFPRPFTFAATSGEAPWLSNSSATFWLS